MIFTDQFSGPGKAVSLVFVSVTVERQLFNKMAFDLDIWRADY